ncbi:MAG: DeoR/GlpR transcriptional regulator [Anaerolineales bacterium]|nr:DeoR/GlpR transcriptional regulator [Anaerolineales bacterium]
MKKSAPLLPAERQQRILEILRDELSVRGSRLGELLGVSEMTIRRDLDALERQGVVERTHGGAVFRQERVVGKFHYNSAGQENLREKQRIARRAADIIEPNDIIFLGEGTTCAQMIRYVDSGMPFTIFTNNLGVISEIEDKTGDLILLGGTYNHTTRALAGPLTMEMISQVNVIKLFLGADGFSLNAGLTTPNLEIATVERSMIRHTRGKVIVMADHSKFGLVAEIVVTPIKNIDVLITDRKIPDDFEQDLRSMNVEVVIA